MKTKELNLKFDGAFIHVRTNGEIYRIVVDNGGNPIAFDLSLEEFCSLCDGISRMNESIKK